MKNSLVNKLKKYINNNQDNVFTLSDLNNKQFKEFTYSSIKRTINQFKQNGLIKQVMPGIYYKPRLIKSIGEYTLPDTEDVVEALASKRRWLVCPTGERSLNMLGLSNQLSFVYMYASTGPYKQYKINNCKVIFKRCKANELIGMSFITKLVIQAIKTLGKENINSKVKNILKNKFDEPTKQKILNESRQTTRWIGDVIEEVFN